MATRKVSSFYGSVGKKKTRCGAGRRSKGMKKLRGQGGPRKRCKQPRK